ncbi:hypothetical protein LV89_01277 [Arcicella aurantiaca]|uniref:Uncharacterized protein n=1 Tax=Arcicella aurantiaca TaxID=591202 RepID=A0A316ECK4_9BACT|nr:hypothetical protein [Arcicella aurantiaca]PWK27870.1 hypothetical protein LV89_01277 [Arcicella aurantiaca]
MSALLQSPEEIEIDNQKIMNIIEGLEHFKSRMPTLSIYNSINLQNALTEVTNQRKVISNQIIVCGIIGLCIFGSGIYVLYKIVNKISILSPDLEIPLIIITSLIIVVLSILASFIYKLNKIGESLANKHLALSTFNKMQPLLQNTNNDTSYEYRDVVKRILDSLNNMIDNTQNII